MVERAIVQNPVLRLLTRPVRERPDARGKSRKRIKDALRFSNHRRHLLERLAALPNDPAKRRATHAGRYLIWAGVHSDSLASTHTPSDLFSPGVGAIMRMAWRDGYVVEVTDQVLLNLARRVVSPANAAHECDIYSVNRLEIFATVVAFDEGLDRAWRAAPADGAGLRRFNVRLAQYAQADAQISVAATLTALLAENRVRLGGPTPDAAGALVSTERWLTPTEAPLALQPKQRISLAISDQESLRELVMTGSITRWEPIAGLRPTEPGEGPEPPVDLPDMDNDPIVGVIDGGYHARRYQGVVAWRQTPPLIADGEAAREHGNKVASVVVDAHLWSNQLQMPELHCRLGVVQAVPRDDTHLTLLNDATLRHVEGAFASHPDTHVWNLSANLERECDVFEVSELGHGLNELARGHNKLLVISAGNRREDSLRVAPPADCEAALVVAGRQHRLDGAVAGECGVSRVGLGPEGMLKPETSWFSTLRVLGGGVASGTSFAAPLVSRLAAHTWQNLDTPSPDMVKALLLNASDLDKYSHAMGFGSPVRPELPWNCAPNAAVIAWQEPMTYMESYYWTGIRIPPSLMDGGVFRGRAKMVAILAPHVDFDGHHYFQTRIQAGLYHRAFNKKGIEENVRLCGCKNPQQLETDARREDNKWDPVRVYERDCRRTKGVAIAGTQPELRVGARLYWRDTFRYSAEFMRQTPCRVTFVVMLESRDPEAEAYNEFRRIMAENVESAVVEQGVEVDLEAEL